MCPRGSTCVLDMFSAPCLPTSLLVGVNSKNSDVVSSSRSNHDLSANAFMCMRGCYQCLTKWTRNIDNVDQCRFVHFLGLYFAFIGITFASYLHLSFSKCGIPQMHTSPVSQKAPRNGGCSARYGSKPQATATENSHRLTSLKAALLHDLGVLKKHECFEMNTWWNE